MLIRWLKIKFTSLILEKNWFCGLVLMKIFRGALSTRREKELISYTQNDEIAHLIESQNHVTRIYSPAFTYVHVNGSWSEIARILCYDLNWSDILFRVFIRINRILFANVSEVCAPTHVTRAQWSKKGLTV